MRQSQLFDEKHRRQKPGHYLNALLAYPDIDQDWDTSGKVVFFTFEDGSQITADNGDILVWPLGYGQPLD